MNELLSNGSPDKEKLTTMFREMVTLHKHHLIEDESIRASLATQLVADIPTMFQDEKSVVDFLMEVANQREGTTVMRLSESSERESFLLIRKMTEVLNHYRGTDAA